MGYKIYTLTCPDSKNIVYVGLTQLSLRDRLYGHMNAVSTNPIKSRWIESLKSRNIKPEISEIDYSDDKKHASSLEAYWIRQLTAWNFVLMNRDYNTKKRVIKPYFKANLKSLTKAKAVSIKIKLSKHYFRQEEFSKYLGCTTASLSGYLNTKKLCRMRLEVYNKLIAFSKMKIAEVEEIRSDEHKQYVRECDERLAEIMQKYYPKRKKH